MARVRSLTASPHQAREIFQAVRPIGVRRARRWNVESAGQMRGVMLDEVKFRANCSRRHVKSCHRVFARPSKAVRDTSAAKPEFGRPYGESALFQAEPTDFAGQQYDPRPKALHPADLDGAESPAHEVAATFFTIAFFLGGGK
jgi:hypothetical protein